MKYIWKWFLQGIALIAPVALTIALLLWLGGWAERTFGPLIAAILPTGLQFHGMGIAGAVLITLAIGLTANLFLVRRVLGLVEAILERIPLVTSLYQAFKDVARLFGQDAEEHLGQVVAVDVEGVQLIGFVMQNDSQLPGQFSDDETRVAVYVAMSYQIGGFTIHVPRSRITPLDVPADQAMRAVLTGGKLQARAGVPVARRA